MTCAIAMNCTDGILLASDSLVSGDSKATLPDIKGFQWRGLDVLYAGDLAYIQKLQAYPGTEYPEGQVSSLQALLWTYPAGDGEEAEFIVVDDSWAIHIVDKWGAAIPCQDFAVIGSCIGGGCMHMLDKRERTMVQAKRAAARVLRAVARMDSSVAEPFRYHELFFA